MNVSFKQLILEAPNLDHRAASCSQTDDVNSLQCDLNGSVGADVYPLSCSAIFAHFQSIFSRFDKVEKIVLPLLLIFLTSSCYTNIMILGF